MRKFEGNINGKVYTDENEFHNAIAEMNNLVGDMYVSYKYVSAPDIENVEEKIKSDLERKKREKILADYIQRLRSAAVIKYFL